MEQQLNYEHVVLDQQQNNITHNFNFVVAPAQPFVGLDQELEVEQVVVESMWYLNQVNVVVAVRAKSNWYVVNRKQFIRFVWLVTIKLFRDYKDNNN